MRFRLLLTRLLAPKSLKCDLFLLSLDFLVVLVKFLLKKPLLLDDNVNEEALTFKLLVEYGHVFHRHKVW